MAESSETAVRGSAQVWVRAYHPPSGSVITGEVTDVMGVAPHRSLRIIPDGLLEAVIVRDETWVITDA